MSKINPLKFQEFIEGEKIKDPTWAEVLIYGVAIGIILLFVMVLLLLIVNPSSTPFDPFAAPFIINP